MKKVSKSDIEKIGLSNATVHACITAHRAPHSGITWEEALMAMVVYLVEDNRALEATCRELMVRRPQLYSTTKQDH